MDDFTAAHGIDDDVQFESVLDLGNTCDLVFADLIQTTEGDDYGDIGFEEFLEAVKQRLGEQYSDTLEAAVKRMFVVISLRFHADAEKGLIGV